MWNITSDHRTSRCEEFYGSQRTTGVDKLTTAMDFKRRHSDEDFKRRHSDEEFERRHSDDDFKMKTKSSFYINVGKHVGRCFLNTPVPKPSGIAAADEKNEKGTWVDCRNPALSLPHRLKRGCSHD
ncbi:hypothetical protein JTE90_008164 [Oedothorax gibbosus]|uniref:Uncharacterized protein n=1 Tax=Oedothorax gibbosus TaxID=931172 RepID=A0AAV6VGZ7_9ARAC|nr:hypothetical protein JTE90_008164 [Oedothorax gibbosus]